MAKLTTKRALICLLLLAILLVVLYSFLLDQKNTTVHVQDRVLHSEAGRLVARSQFSFHHIMEQWVQPGGKKNHSTMRKERLIEDGQVIKEAFDYGESENERVNLHLNQFTNLSSRNKHLTNKKLLQREFSLAHLKSLSKNENSSSLVHAKQHWLQPEDVNHLQPSLLQNNHNEPIIHKSAYNKRASNGTKSIKANDNFSDKEGDSKIEVNSHNLKVEFANLHVQRSEHHDGTGSKEMIPGIADQSLGGESKDAVVETQLEHGLSPIESKVKPDFRSPHEEVVPMRSDKGADVRSDDRSDGNDWDAQTKHGVVPEKPVVQSKDAVSNSQAKQEAGKLSESKSKPVIVNRQSPVENMRPGAEVETMDAHIPIRHKVLSYKSDAVNRDAQMPKGYERESSSTARHKQLSMLKRDIHAQVPMGLDSMDTEAAAHGAVSELKTKSGVAKPAPLNAESAKSGLNANAENKGAIVNKHAQSLNSNVKPAMTSRNASKSYLVYRPPPKPKTKLKSANSSASKEQVMYVNSHGRTIRVVKHQNSASSPKTYKSALQNQKKYGAVKQGNNTRVNPAPPLVLHANSSSSHRSLSVNPFDQEDFDFDSDPRYAHLPLSVKKKLAEIRKNRINRIKYVRLIRKRCEGKKYCVQNVKSNERSRHDSCFYDAIMAEKDGIELSPCHCTLMPTTGRGMSTKLSHGVVSSSEVYKVRPSVALVSLPGSGNTWVRGLLEEATGYCTGSMWCDPVLRAKQFCAEGLRSNTLVIKNHDPNIRWLKEELAVNSSELVKPPFSSAIFVHRDPYEATIAEWNRALGYKVYNATKHNFTVAGIGDYNISAVKDQHTVTFGKEAFGRNPGWNWTIYQQMENWEAMINHLLINASDRNPVLLVKYEDLKRDAISEVERMLMFLDIKVTTTVREKLKNGFHAFHRNHTYTFDHYTVEQKIYMNEVINRVSKRLQYHNIDYLHVHKYLRD